VLNEEGTIEPHDCLFTGQRYERSTGLYDFQQRWYDPDCGRFLGVDPVVQAPADPQTVNSYGYVGNNPTTNLDPDGRIFGSGFGGMGTAAALNGMGGSPLYAGAAAAGGAAGGTEPEEPPRRKTAKELALGDGSVRGSNFAGNPALKATFDGAGIDASGRATAAGAISSALGIDVGAAQELLLNLHASAVEYNNVVSISYALAPLGAGPAVFVTINVDPSFNVSLDVGIGFGGGNLAAFSAAAAGSLTGGDLGSLRLEFMAGGALPMLGFLGAFQRAAASASGAEAGGGLLFGVGGFVFGGVVWTVGSWQIDGNTFATPPVKPFGGGGGGSIP
jgi:RHS repeat-associated protein